tara:strand:- start:1621 stop:2289 length:669 start_codon:yes stop_codon:yes gene_type:complete
MSIEKIIGKGLTSKASREKLVANLRNLGIKNNDVIDLICNIPRHLFIETALANRAYENVSLPIGFRQTISQPYMVAKMTELLHESQSMNNVLEIGTGSGYQTSILSMLFNKVTTIERIDSLHHQSKKRLTNMGFKNISYVLGDGYLGFRKNSPYDAIIITAAAHKIPDKLIDQLTPNGRVVLPLETNKHQQLVKLKNTKNGIIKKVIEDVVFVPMLEGVENS